MIELGLIIVEPIYSAQLTYCPNQSRQQTFQRKKLHKHKLFFATSMALQSSTSSTTQASRNTAHSHFFGKLVILYIYINRLKLSVRIVGASYVLVTKVLFG